MNHFLRLPLRAPGTAAITAAALGVAMLCSAPTAALAQAYPNKPVRMIIPFAPGGVTDLMGRLVAERMARGLGQQMFVENRAGASGNIGTAQIINAAPDGYNILLSFDGTMAINPNLSEKPAFDSVKDLAPIGRIGYSISVLVANPSAPIKSMSDVISLAKARPGGLSYGTSGNGGSMHLAGELLKQRTGANLVHVPYKGSAPATLAAVSGDIPIALVAIGGAQQFIRSGKLNAIAVPAGRRSPNLPNVPTFVEAGVSDYSIASWFGLFAPANTPRAVIDRLNSELNTVLRDADTQTRLAAMDVTATPSTPEELSEELKRDLTRFGAIVKSAGIKSN